MEKINWNTIKTSNGTAVNIPEALELLKSNLLEDRKKGYWLIDNHAILQSDLYEAAYYVIDPLIDLLHSIEIEKKSLIIDLLIEIAYGCAPISMFIVVDNERIPLQNACRLKLRKEEEEIELLTHKMEDKKMKDKLNELLDAINSD